MNSGANRQRPQGPQSDLDDLADHPVVHISWDDAGVYCTWVGGSLPTEAQWEYATCGPDSLTYPWGSNADGSAANFCDVNCPRAWADGSWDDGFALTSPVDNYPGGGSWVDSLDMAGNVWNWVRDWYASTYYASSPRENPPGPADGTNKVFRGGSWGDGLDSGMRSSNRNNEDPSHRTGGLGFRCIREIP